MQGKGYSLIFVDKLDEGLIIMSIKPLVVLYFRGSFTGEKGMPSHRRDYGV